VPGEEGPASQHVEVVVCLFVLTRSVEIAGMLRVATTSPTQRMENHRTAQEMTTSQTTSQHTNQPTHPPTNQPTNPPTNSPNIPTTTTNQQNKRTKQTDLTRALVDSA
jgi:hypothetical protein